VRLPTPRPWFTLVVRLPTFLCTVCVGTGLQVLPTVESPCITTFHLPLMHHTANYQLSVCISSIDRFHGTSGDSKDLRTTMHSATTTVVGIGPVAWDVSCSWQLRRHLHLLIKRESANQTIIEVARAFFRGRSRDSFGNQGSSGVTHHSGFITGQRALQVHWMDIEQ